MSRARFLVPLVLAVAIGAGALFACTPAAAQAPARYRPGEVIVKYRPGARTAERFSARGRVGAQPLRSFEFIGAKLLSIGSLDVTDAVARLRADPIVEYAEPNYELHALVVPNDPQFGQMYALQNTGQTGGTPGADIHATQAWDIFTGDQELKIGVIDTGIDYTHPDLAANIWSNPGEIAGNGVDDDHNGYVDDVRGWDFANNDADPMDDNNHGTHCAGTVGGVGNNGLGVAGVNWKVKLLPVKFLTASGSGSLWAGAQTILYAAQMKVQVVSASWGCTGQGCYASYLEQALQTLAASGGLFVAAAGNNYGNNIDSNPTYPAAYNVPNLLAV